MAWSWASIWSWSGPSTCRKSRRGPKRPATGRCSCPTTWCSRRGSTALSVQPRRLVPVPARHAAVRPVGRADHHRGGHHDDQARHRGLRAPAPAPVRHRARGHVARRAVRRARGARCGCGLADGGVHRPRTRPEAALLPHRGVHRGAARALDRDDPVVPRPPLRLRRGALRAAAGHRSAPPDPPRRRLRPRARARRSIRRRLDLRRHRERRRRDRGDGHEAPSAPGPRPRPRHRSTSPCSCRDRRSTTSPGSRRSASTAW